MEFRAFDSIDGPGGERFLVICDHASNALPPDYGALGLAPHHLERHIAYDIGAASVARTLAEALHAPAVLAGFSRLLIDPNRGEDDPTLVMKLSDGAVIPANRDVDPYRNVSEWHHRVDAYWRPYHAAISAALDDAVAKGAVPTILSIHSFTPAWHGVARPWEIGLLWDRDDRWAKALAARLDREDLTVGDNLPYTGRLKNDCLYRHGTLRGLPHILIELRQDLIANPDGQRHWAQFLAGVILELAAGPLAEEIGKVRHFGSTTDP